MPAIEYSDLFTDADVLVENKLFATLDTTVAPV
jgi:50S ribosomal subunit-associated GTPase HflX